MKRTILTVLAGSLAALTLGVTAAHAEEWQGRPPPAPQQRYDRDDHVRGRPEVRRSRYRSDDRYCDSRYVHDYRRNARVDVYDGDRGLSVRIGGFLASR
jgi:Ni/Co efflux regulator RcnB